MIPKEEVSTNFFLLFTHQHQKQNIFDVLFVKLVLSVGVGLQYKPCEMISKEEVSTNIFLFFTVQHRKTNIFDVLFVKLVLSVGVFFPSLFSIEKQIFLTFFFLN